MSRFFCDNNDDIKSEIKKENEHSVKNEWRVGSSTYSAWNMLEKSAQSPLKSIPIVGKEQSTTQPCVLISNMNDSRAQFTDTAQAITNEPLYYNVSSRCELEEVVDLPKIFKETSANEDIAQGSETTQCCEVVYNEELHTQEYEEVEAEVQIEDAAEVGAYEQAEIEPEAEAEPEAEPEPMPEHECEFAEAALQAETAEEAQAAEEVEETTTQAEAEVEPEPEPMLEYECKFAEAEMQAEAVAEDEIEAVPEAEAECKETQATEQPEAEPMPKYEEESETEQIITSQPKTTILDHDVLNVDNVSGYEDEIIQL